jgi:hypothetical protein
MPDCAEHLPYLRHKNGNGKIFDNSEVCERSTTDRVTQVSGDSGVWTSDIRGSRIINSTVTDSVVTNSWVENSEVHNAKIGFSVIAAELVTSGATIFNSKVLGRSRVAHDAVLKNVRIRDLTVKGDALLMDWPDDVFDGCQGYISRGVWRRAPRVIRLDFGVTITESVPGYAYVACREHSIDHWFVAGDRIGKAQGWTYAQVDQVRRVLEVWTVTPRPTDAACDVLPASSNSAETIDRWPFR